jgi:hypothetical protein
VGAVVGTLVGTGVGVPVGSDVGAAVGAVVATQLAELQSFTKPSKHAHVYRSSKLTNVSTSASVLLLLLPLLLPEPL